MNYEIGLKSHVDSASSSGEKHAVNANARTEDIDAGSLVAVPEALAREASFRVPIAFTRSAWDDCVRVANGSSEDEESRIFDVLFMALNAIRRKERRTAQADFIVHRAKAGEVHRSPVALIARVGRGDSGEPVLTILLVSED